MSHTHTRASSRGKTEEEEKGEYIDVCVHKEMKKKKIKRRKNVLYMCIGVFIIRLYQKKGGGGSESNLGAMTSPMEFFFSSSSPQCRIYILFFFF
jgi:hypothetical protein